MVSGFLCIIYFFIIPTLIGLVFTYFMKKEKNSLMYSWIIGFLTEFAICQLFTIPYTFAGKSFNSLFYTCIGIYLVISVVSILINFKNVKDIARKSVKFLKSLVDFWAIIAIILIGFQCFVLFNYMHIDEDDSNFVAKATISLDTNTLYKYDDIGNELEKLPYRNGLSPFPIYTAIVSKFVQIHPMIVAHTIFPVIFTLVIYCVYYLLGMKLFNNKRQNVNIFLIMVNLVYIFGNISTWSNTTRMFFRLWQGKTVLGDFILPAIILLYDSFVRGKAKFIYFIVLLITMWSACLVSTMGFALAPVLLAILTFIYCLRSININFKKQDKNIKKSIISVLNIGFKSAICCIPTGIYVVLHLLLKEGILC